MKNKILFTVGISAFLMFLISLVSAGMTLYPDTYSATIQQGNSSVFTFKIYNDGGTNGNYTLVNLTATKSNLTSSTGTISSNNIIIGTIPDSITNKTNSSDISVTINVPADQPLGIYTGTITIHGVNNETGHSVADKTISLTITVTQKPQPPAPNEPEDITECKETGNLGNNLRVRIEDITTVQGFGSDEDYWYPLDKVEVEVNVKNRGNDDIRKIKVKWGIYSLEKEDFVMDGKESEFKLKDGDDKTITIDFKLDNPRDFKHGGDYVLYVWATGEDDEFGKNDTCEYDSQDIDIRTDTDFVILSDLELTPSDTVECGSKVLLTGNAWNIGEDDLNDVSIDIYNKELGISKNVYIGDINDFSKEAFSFEFDIPKNVSEKKYYLTLEVLDEDGDIFQNEEDDDARFVVPFEVKGNCASSVTPPQGTQASVSASLETGGNAGEPLVVRAIITNTGTEQEIDTISASGYESWAELEDISEEAIQLNPGESKEIVLTFNVKEDASGENRFDIVVTGTGKTPFTQPVQVSIKPKQTGWNLPAIQSNLLIIILVGLIILVLIIIIIVLAVKSARK